MFKKSLKSKAFFSFYQLLGIALGFFSLLLLLMIRISPDLQILGRNFWHKLETACGCTNHLSFFMHPFLYTTLILSGLIFVCFAFFVFYRIIKLRKKTNNFIKINLAKAKTEPSLKLKKIIQDLNLQSLVIEIKDQNPVVFCYGLIKPKICISSGLVAKMNDRELEAVLLHEQYHLLVREPLKLFVINLLEKTLFFLPGIKYLAGQYRLFSELSADERATNGFKNKKPLADALCRILAWEEQLILKDNLGLSFFSHKESTDIRINKLVDDRYAPEFKIFSFRILLGFVLLLTAFVYTNKLVSYDNQTLNQGTNMCMITSMPSTDSNQCFGYDLKPGQCDFSYLPNNNNCTM